MGEAGVCWRCAIGRAAASAQRLWNEAFGETQSCEKPKGDVNMDGQPRSTASRSTSPQGAGSGQRILGHAPTIHSVVVVAYPKITEGPALVRRKLGSNHWDAIHEGIQGQKRDAATCASDYQLCPASMNGGCCPTDRVCGTSSCLPKSAASASACGHAGYFGCEIVDGGGCCPTGYICGLGNCSPSPGISDTQTCSLSYTLCPSSLGGCCKSGEACGVNKCYATTPTTFTLVETTTTTDGNLSPHTLTTTITSVTIETPTYTTTKDGVLNQLPTSAPTDAIAKTNPNSSPSNGLTKPELGGIIGGALFILIVLIIAAWLILRRLHKASKLLELANSRSSSSARRSGRSNSRPQNQDIDAMSIDPLMITPSEMTSTIRRPSHISGANSIIHEMETNSPPIFNSPFSPRTPPYTHYPKGYNPVSGSDSNYSQSSGGYRHGSVELSPQLQHNPNAGYFDLSPRSPAGHRGSAGSTPSAMTRRPSQHGRHWSNASDQSQVSQNSSNPAELDAQTPPRSGFSRAIHELGVGMSRMVSIRRRRSDPPVLTGGPVRPEWPGRQELGHIPEAGESRLNLPPLSGGPDRADFSSAQMRAIGPPGGPDRGRGEIGGISNAEMREISLLDPQSPIVKDATTQVRSFEVTEEVPEFLSGNEPGR